MPDTPVIFLNGEFVPRSDARVRVDDRGLSFADGVYELTRYVAGRPFELAAHTTRLQRSLAGIGIASTPPIEQLPDASAQLLVRNGLTDATVYWSVTRGPGPRDRRFPATAEPTVMAIADPVAPLNPSAPTPTRTAILLDDQRWARCDLKTLMLLPSVLARNEAAAVGRDEAILHRDGLVTEATASNVFIVRDGTLHTPPTGPEILAGITRDVVLTLAREMSLFVVESPFDVDALLAADEVFFTGTTTHVTAATRVDDRRYDVGPITQRLHAALIERMLKSSAE